MGDINWKDRCWVTTIYLVREDKKVLLTMNKNLKTWIPMGGHIDPGESPDEAIKREVKEESGFEFDFLHEKQIVQEGNVEVLTPSHIQLESVPHHNIHMNIVWFGKCTKYTDKETTDEDEKLKWFSKDELEAIKQDLLESVYKNALEAINVFT